MATINYFLSTLSFSFKKGATSILSFKAKFSWKNTKECARTSVVPVQGGDSA